MRDSQRQKVYDAEDAVFDPHYSKLVLNSLEDAQKLVDAVCASATIRERYPRWHGRVPTVKRSHGRRNGACFDPCKWVIELDASTQTPNVTLHELAHALVRPSTPKKIAPHGREFAACYLDLVRVYMGRHWAEKLETSFKAHRVVYKPKRAYTITDDERRRRADRARSLARAR